MAISNSGSVGRGRPFSRLADRSERNSQSRYDIWQRAVAECRRSSKRIQHRPSRVSSAADCNLLAPIAVR